MSVNFHELRGYAATIPKPVMAHLSNPTHLIFTLKSHKVELRAARGTGSRL